MNTRHTDQSSCASLVVKNRKALLLVVVGLAVGLNLWYVKHRDQVTDVAAALSQQSHQSRLQFTAGDQQVHLNGVDEEKSRLECHVEQDAEFDGEEVLRWGSDNQLDSPEECCAACHALPGCNVWAYCSAQDGTCPQHSKPGECWLKKKADLDVLTPQGHRVAGGGWVSGAIYSEVELSQAQQAAEARKKEAADAEAKAKAVAAAKKQQEEAKAAAAARKQQEEAEAAARKQQEEAEAAARKQQEEAEAAAKKQQEGDAVAAAAAGAQGQTEEQRLKALRSNDTLPLVWFDITIKGQPRGRIEFVLFPHISPRSAENFRQFCTGEHGVVPEGREGAGKPYHFKGGYFYRIIDRFIDQAGVYVDSVFGGQFKDDPAGKELKHTHKGLLSMANMGPDTNTAHFSIMMAPAPHLDGRHTIFGEVVTGFEVIDAINALSVGKPENTAGVEEEVVIADAGQIRKGTWVPDLTLGL